MSAQLDVLNPAEKEKIINAIAQITVLVAGADGNIDIKEKDWAEKVMKIRSYNNPKDLNDYYKLVGEKYSIKVDLLTDQLKDTAQRNQTLTEKLSELNPILAKLDQNFAASLYLSLVSFAKHVAKASGGFLGMGTISHAEQEFIELPMINPIEYIDPPVDHLEEEEVDES